MNTYRNIKLTIEYDGTHFSGWQRQAKERTVQGDIERALKELTAEKINLIAAGRTDAGVHALGQAANFKTKSKLPIDRFAPAINSLLPKDILVKEAQEVALRFNSRRDARSKVYRYRIFLGQTALQRTYLWPYRFRVALPQMRKTTKYIVGKHDFTSFCVAKSRKGSNICVIKKAIWKKSGNMLEFEIEGDRFLRSMIRIIVGTLMEVGRGKISPTEFKGILSARDRRRAGLTAPACGLYLVEVKY